VRVVGLAMHQHGVVTRAQLLGLGVSKSAIARWVRAQRLHRVHQGVYAVGRPDLTREGRFMAAVLACGDGAALSHFAAAVLWALIPDRGPRIDVTVPGTGGRSRRRLVVVHRAPLGPEDTTVKDAIPVTTPVRTLTDLADVVPRRELERAIDEAHYLRLDLTAIRPIPGRRGSGLLKRVLETHEPGSTRTESPLAERMLAICDGAALPRPGVEVVIEGYRVDFAWPDRRVIVETDGWRAHGTRPAFERDRRRDLALAAAGWRVVRITWRQLEHEPAWVAERLARVLRA
jgi:REase_MTES_1575/Transcriptional regulator, AbiEi antitoxin